MTLYLKGAAVPQWLANGPDVTFGCDAVVEKHDGGYRVRPKAKLSGDECLIRAKDCPTFPKSVLLWTLPND